MCRAIGFRQFPTIIFTERAMRISVLMTMVAMATMACFQSGVMAQSAGDQQQSAIMFDINFEKLKSSKLATTLGIEDKLASVAQSDETKPDAGKLLRVVGAMSAPKNIADAQAVSAGQMPMDFYARMQFEDADGADKMIAKAETESSGKFEKNGKTFYRPKDDGKTPDNMLMHRVDETTIEISTEGYAFLPNRDVLSQGLQDAWALTGDDSIRLAIDVEAASDVISEAVEIGKAQAKGSPQEAQVTAYLGLIDNMKNLRLGIDFSNDNLLTIQATGVDEKQAKELQGGLDSILGIGKMMGGMQLQGLQQQDPETGAVLAQVLDALKANREGAEVNVTIPHPEGLEALAAKFAPMLGISPPATPVEPQAPNQPAEPVPVE